MPYSHGKLIARNDAYSLRLNWSQESFWNSLYLYFLFQHGSCSLEGGSPTFTLFVLTPLLYTDSNWLSFIIVFWEDFSSNFPEQYRIFSKLIRIFLQFQRTKNQMRIRIACGLNSRSWAGFWKNDKSRCTCRKNNRVQ